MYSLYEISEIDSSHQPSSKQKVIHSRHEEHAKDMLQTPQANPDGLRLPKVDAVFNDIAEEISDSVSNPVLPVEHEIVFYSVEHEIVC